MELRPSSVVRRQPSYPHGGLRCLPLGRVLSLIGGLALLAAYFMPWFGLSSPQGSIVLSGDFLGRFLSGTTDLRRFMPGASGDPNEARLLQALVYLFPTCGALATLLVILAALRPGLRTPLNVLLAVVGLVPLVALIVGVSRLPAGASQEIGLRLIGAGALAVLLGVGLDALLLRSTIRDPSSSSPRDLP